MVHVHYLHLLANQSPPEVECHPFIGIVVVEATVTEEWRTLISDWLVCSGCLYMVAWGKECSAWNDSVDDANLTKFDWKDIPDDKFVMTTWHENETLSEALWFAARCAVHPTVAIEHVVIIHIAAHQREAELLSAFEAARHE